MADEIPWTPRVTSHFVEDVNGLSRPMREFVLDQLQLLASDPISLSRVAPTPPYVPGFMMYQFDTEYKGKWFMFRAFFKFGENESKDLTMVWLEAHKFGKVVESN